jgi:uncharacterized DUF497 family protein
MQFKWDIYKAIANVAKHGVGFEQAVSVFDDAYPLITEGFPLSTSGEKRYQIIGEVDPGFIASHHHVLAVVYTVRNDGEIYRLISARPASRVERKLYAIQKRSRESAV